jgi:hypothetical protein
MLKQLAAPLFCAVFLGSGTAAPPVVLPSPQATRPPEIYRVTVSPLCSALHEKVQPAIGMLLQNDRTIAKSPAIFKDYIMAQTDNSDARENLDVLRLQDLVTPLVNNVLAIQKMLENPSVFPPSANTEDAQRLDDLKQKMFAALASQQAALDIINGFVDTQQLADMQHAGFGYIAEIAGEGSGSGASSENQILAQTIGPTPDPMHPQVFDNTALQAGLSPNPYEIDLARIPGLALGYNPIGRLREGLKWTQATGKKSEAALARTVFQTIALCNGSVSHGGP